MVRSYTVASVLRESVQSVKSNQRCDRQWNDSLRYVASLLVDGNSLEVLCKDVVEQTDNSGN